MTSKADWKELSFELFPFHKVDENVKEKIESLISMYSLIGWDFKLSVLLDNENNWRYSFELSKNQRKGTVLPTSLDAVRILLMFILDNDLKFIDLNYSFFALMGTPAYEKISTTYGVFDSTSNNKSVEEIIHIASEALDIASQLHGVH